MRSKSVFGDVVNASRVKSDSMIQSNGSKGGESFLPWCYDRLVRPGRWCTVGKRGGFSRQTFWIWATAYLEYLANLSASASPQIGTRVRIWQTQVSFRSSLWFRDLQSIV